MNRSLSISPMGAKMLIFWYLKPWKQYAAFRGRSNRAEFAIFVLVNTAILGVLTTLTLVTTGLAAIVAWVASIDLMAAIVLPYLAVSARRLHDTNHSGGHCLIMLVPILGQLLSLSLIPLKGDEGANDYGPEPVDPVLSGSANAWINPAEWLVGLPDINQNGR